MFKSKIIKLCFIEETEHYAGGMVMSMSIGYIA